MIISVIIGAFALAFKYLLLTPFEYGCRKFFRKNLDEPAKLSNIVYVFDSHYKNVVKTAFLRDLFIWLWSLLFVIPGIIAAYRYSMALYILLDHPEFGIMDCLRESKAITAGHKMELFKLDLSFLGWGLLTALPYVGFLISVFVTPYYAITHAFYYERLSGHVAQPEYL